MHVRLVLSLTATLSFLLGGCPSEVTPSMDGPGLQTETDPLRTATNPPGTPQADTNQQESSPPADTDNDGILDLDELAIGSDPESADTDGDGVSDRTEADLGLSLTAADSDDDGLDDMDELELGSDPLVQDSDGDSLLDGDEVLLGTSPLLADTDADGLTDDAEVDAGTNPLLGDTDGDTLSDPDELSGGTNPLLADSDGDTLLDGDEIAVGTDPMVVDSDADGLWDADEFAVGTDPLNQDTDGDLLYDGIEVTAGFDPLSVDETGIVSTVHTIQAAEIFSGSQALWYSDRPEFAGWLNGDLIVIERDIDFPSVAFLYNLSLGDVSVAIDYGPVLQSGIISNAAIDLSWLEVGYLTRWVINRFDINSVPLWSFGDFVLVASNPISGLTRIVNLTFGDDALLAS